MTPTKPLTIPRVELCGAVLATKLVKWVHSNLNISDHDIQTYYWTDATIVLHWIQGDINRWKPFVANRISNILKTSKPDQWNHVDTHNNPADCATRGMSPVQLSNFGLWWHGPTWLREDCSNWPTSTLANVAFDSELSEIKQTKIQIHSASLDESLISNYSSYQRLIRIVAIILRFTFNSRTTNKFKPRYGPLTVIELRQSLLQLVRLVQHNVFATEIHSIQANKPLSNKSKLNGLTPYIDVEGILRIRGRLQRTNLSNDRKHPMILPSDHHFTQLILHNAHVMTLHGGTQLTLTYIRQQFWIINSRRTVRNYLRKCIKCFRNKPIITTHLMGELPEQRVTPSTRAFVSTGVDYTGALELKSSKFRGNTTYKSYIAIFICLTTKAIHLEAVTGMDTESFLWALERFTGRRGACRDIFSDNGTNFVGADSILKTQQKQLIKGIEQKIIPKLTAKGHQWHFNSPHSPSFGGLWEANVKSVKYHLKRVMESSKLTYEELSTVLSRIESCLNSRPLCPMTIDPDDLSFLTPGHFLIGDSLLSLPESPTEFISLSERYIIMQKMWKQFWSKWSSDWLHHLQSRPKWQNIQPNLAKNDMVIIKDDRLPQNEWILGRIIELHPGPDQLVRVVTIKTKNGNYKRSVSKVCHLPIPNHAFE